MNKIKVQRRDIIVNNETRPIIGGDFQYFRIPYKLWENSLKKISSAGLDFITIYIPWIWHEIEEDLFDFIGVTSKERDLIGLIKLCEKFNISIFVRPGPYIYAEYQGFGIPDWLRKKHPEILIKYENTQNSNEISLNHPIYLKYVYKWFKSLLVNLKVYLKNGLIFGWQIDNETGLPQFASIPYPGDFNPDTIERYQKFLENKYKLIDILNKQWDTNFNSFNEIKPPLKQKTSKIELHNWADFIEDYIVEYLRTIKNMLIELGVNTFFTHNDPYLNQWPNHSVKKSVISTIGFDIYTKITSSEPETHDLPFSLSYAPEMFKSINKTTPLIGSEIGAGWLDPRVKVKEDATLQSILIPIIRGTKMINLYLFQDCIESNGIPWLFQAPLDKDGNVTPRYNLIKKTINFVNNYGNIIAKSTQIHSPIGLLVYYPQVWDLLKSMVNLWNALDDLNNTIIRFCGASSFLGILSECGYNPEVLELTNSSIGDLTKYRILFFGSTGVLDQKSYKKLLDYVESGGTLVTYGYPVTTDISGKPIVDNPLFPGKPYGKNKIIQLGINSIIPQVTLDIIEYQISKTKIQHKLSLYTIDMMQPLVELMKYIGKIGTWITTDRQEKFWATLFISLWEGGGINQLLLHEQKTVGYWKRIRAGKSIFIGTMPGLFYDSTVYYSMEEDKKESIRKFFQTILIESGIKPLNTGVPGVEIVLRQADDKLIVFVINRGKTKDFYIDIKIPYLYEEELDLIFSAKNSTVELETITIPESLIKCHIEEDDIIGFILKINKKIEQ